MWPCGRVVVNASCGPAAVHGPVALPCSSREADRGMGVLQDQVAIVTGGGRGIGAAYCRALAAEGARVVVADIRESDACALAEELGGLGCPVDVADESSVQA